MKQVEWNRLKLIKIQVQIISSQCKDERKRMMAYAELTGAIGLFLRKLKES